MQILDTMNATKTKLDKIMVLTRRESQWHKPTEATWMHYIEDAQFHSVVGCENERMISKYMQNVILTDN